jgi:hypothetical protein
VIAE